MFHKGLKYFKTVPYVNVLNEFGRFAAYQREPNASVFPNFEGCM